MLDSITHIAPAGQDGGFSVVAEEELHQLRDGDVNRIALLLFGEDSGEQSDLYTSTTAKRTTRCRQTGCT